MMKLLGVLAGAVLALGLAAPQAKAVVIYDWTGTCGLNCVGQASAALTLADSYTPGTFATTADFISFSYSSSSGAYDIPADAALVSFQSVGGLPAVSGTANVDLEFAGNVTAFRTSPSLWASFFTPADIFFDGGSSENTWTL